MIMVHARSSTHFWLVILLVMKTHGVVLDITFDGDPLTGEAITLACNIPSYNQSASWKNSALLSGAIQTCGPGFCPSTNPSYPGYTFSSNSTAFIVVIASAVLDDNTWTCEHNSGADTGAKTLNLKVAPTTCTLAVSGDIYTCTSSCGYPASDMSIRARLNGTSNTQALSITAASSPACTSPESAYSGTVPESFFTQSGYLYCECGVTGFESSFTQSNSEPVTATTTTTTTTTTTPATTSTSTTPATVNNKLMLIYALGGGGIFAAVLCIIIVWTVYCHFCAKKEYCSCCAVFKCCFPPDSSEDEEKKKGCKKCTERQSWIASLVLTVVCVFGLLFCIIGMAIASSSEGAGLGLVVFGLVMAVVSLLIVIILVTLVRLKKIIISAAKGRT